MSVELETGSNRYVHNINSSKDWLGESIVVKAANKPIFVGVVTNVQLHREGSDFGCIIVSGYSATYRMETAHSCFSWNDRTIGDVVKKLTEQSFCMCAKGGKISFIDTGSNSFVESE